MDGQPMRPERRESEIMIVKKHLGSYTFIKMLELNFDKDKIGEIVTEINNSNEDAGETSLDAILNLSTHDMNVEKSRISVVLTDNEIKQTVLDVLQDESLIEKYMEFVNTLIEYWKLRNEKVISKLRKGSKLILDIKDDGSPNIPEDTAKQLMDFVKIYKGLNSIVGKSIARKISIEIPSLKLEYIDLSKYLGSFVVEFKVIDVTEKKENIESTPSRSEHYKSNIGDFLNQYVSKLVEINRKSNRNEINIQINNFESLSYSFMKKLTDSDLRFLQGDIRIFIESEFNSIIDEISIKQLEDKSFIFHIKFGADKSPVVVIENQSTTPKQLQDNADQAKFKREIKDFLNRVGSLLDKKLRAGSLKEGGSVIELIKQENKEVFNFLKEYMHLKNEISELIKHKLENSINGLEVTVELKDPQGKQWDEQIYDINIVIESTAETAKQKEAIERELRELKIDIEDVGEKAIKIGNYRSFLKDETIKSIVANIFTGENWIISYTNMQSSYLDGLRGDNLGTLVIKSKKYEEETTAKLQAEKNLLKQMIDAQNQIIDERKLTQALNLLGEDDIYISDMTPEQEKERFQIGEVKLYRIFFNVAKVTQLKSKYYSRLKEKFLAAGIQENELESFIVPVIGRLAKWIEQQLGDKIGDIGVMYFPDKQRELNTPEVKVVLKTKLIAEFKFKDEPKLDNLLRDLILIACAIHTDSNQDIDAKLQELLRELKNAEIIDPITPTPTNKEMPRSLRGADRPDRNQSNIPNAYTNEKNIQSNTKNPVKKTRNEG